MVHRYDHAIGLRAVECVVLVLDLLCQLSFYGKIFHDVGH